MCLLRCSPLLKHFPQSSTWHTYPRAIFVGVTAADDSSGTEGGVISPDYEEAVGTRRPRLFFVRLGTGTGGAVRIRGPRRSVVSNAVDESRNVYSAVTGGMPTAWRWGGTPGTVGAPFHHLVVLMLSGFRGRYRRGRRCTAKIPLQFASSRSIFTVHSGPLYGVLRLQSCCADHPRAAASLGCSLPVNAVVSSLRLDRFASDYGFDITLTPVDCAAQADASVAVTEEQQCCRRDQACAPFCLA